MVGSQVELPDLYRLWYFNLVNPWLCHLAGGILSFVSKLCIYLRVGLSQFLKQLNQNSQSKGGTAITAAGIIGKVSNVGLHWLSPWPVGYRTCPYLRWHYAVHLDASVTSLGLVWELVKFFISLFDYQILKIGLHGVHDDSFWWFGCITFWFVLPG